MARTRPKLSLDLFVDGLHDPSWSRSKVKLDLFVDGLQEAS